MCSCSGLCCRRLRSKSQDAGCRSARWATMRMKEARLSVLSSGPKVHGATVGRDVDRWTCGGLGQTAVRQ